VAETIGSFGTELGRFSRPGGIAVDAESNLYVADSCNHRVQKITPAGEVYGLGGEGLLLYPQGVAVDHVRSIYVVEHGANRLQKFGPRGQWLLAVGGPESARPRFASPTDICVDAYHHVYVADTDNNRVTCYSATGRWQIDYHGPTSQHPLGAGEGLCL
jgi:DNA-binding beta-propeller fold protein YncE